MTGVPLQRAERLGERAVRYRRRIRGETGGIRQIVTRYKTGAANLALRLPSLLRLAPADTLWRAIDGVDRPTPGTRSASLWTP
jgi:hypothetical protein